MTNSSNHSRIALLLITAIVFSLTVSTASVQGEMEKMEKQSMRDITAEGGLGARLNLRINVPSTWDHIHDDGQGNGNGIFEVQDSDGYTDPSSSYGAGWLMFDHIFGTIESNDNVIHVDANTNIISFSAPNPITGINLHIDDIQVGSFSGDSNGGDLASIGLADDGSGNSNYLDNDATFDLHNTELELY